MEPTEIKQRRALLGWRQIDLAERVGVTREYMARIESGKQVPGDDTARRIEEVLSEATLERDDDTPSCGTVNKYGDVALGPHPSDRPFSVKMYGQSAFKDGSRAIVDPRVPFSADDLVVVRSVRTQRVWMGYITFMDNLVSIRTDASGESLVIPSDACSVVGKVTWVDLR